MCDSKAPLLIPFYNASSATYMTGIDEISRDYGPNTPVTFVWSSVVDP